ncbi:MAG: hypothetical protein JW932_02655 [Deltaproteobacteria bacterium]|nr:hypothetical protein [Deltaproteobacteria bacterium]
MKKLYRIGLISIVMILMMVPTISQAFSSATHIYIAEKVFNPIRNKIDLYYGSMAPDMALYVADAVRWPSAFLDTHYHYMDLRSYARGNIQTAFAKGWLTHNEAWGADYFAHIEYPFGSGNDGYVIQKATQLVDMFEMLNIEFAHFAIEVAIDLLLKNDDPSLGGKLLFANLLRSWQDRNLLANVLVWQERRTDWFTLAMSELTFRNLIHQYALAFSLPGQQAKDALAELGVQLASEMYGIEGVTPEQLFVILDAAISLCVADYQDVIHHTINQIKNNL